MSFITGPDLPPDCVGESCSDIYGSYDDKFMGGPRCCCSIDTVGNTYALRLMSSCLTDPQNWHIKPTEVCFLFPCSTAHLHKITSCFYLHWDEPGEKSSLRRPQNHDISLTAISAPLVSRRGAQTNLAIIQEFQLSAPNKCLFASQISGFNANVSVSSPAWGK